MKKKLEIIYDEMFNYIQTIKPLEEDERLILNSELLMLIAHILEQERWNEKKQKFDNPNR